MNKLISLSQFVFWLNSMTTTELIMRFPNTFHLPLAGDAQDSTVIKMISNDAILWRLVKQYAQFLERELKIEMFEGKDKIFSGGEYVDRQPSMFFKNYYMIAGMKVFTDTNKQVNKSLGHKVSFIADRGIIIQDSAWKR